MLAPHPQWLAGSTAALLLLPSSLAASRCSAGRPRAGAGHRSRNGPVAALDGRAPPSVTFASRPDDARARGAGVRRSETRP